MSKKLMNMLPDELKVLKALFSTGIVLLLISALFFAVLFIGINLHAWGLLPEVISSLGGAAAITFITCLIMGGVLIGSTCDEKSRDPYDEDYTIS
jgi:hypothetical protein